MMVESKQKVCCLGAVLVGVLEASAGLGQKQDAGPDGHGQYDLFVS